MSQVQLDRLQQFSACDVSDALLKLEVVESGQRALAGFLDDLEPRTGLPTSKFDPVPNLKVIAPAFTVQFQPKTPTNGDFCSPKASSSNIESGAQWSDLAEDGTIVVIQQPEGQKCAVLGGIHAINIDRRKARGIVVSGQIRDMGELRKLSIPIWARGTSTVGTAAESKPYAVQVPINVNGVSINPGDIIFCDMAEGVVVIPRGMLDQVLQYMSDHAQAEENIKEAVSGGMSVAEAFSRWR
ncbi:hypothetical protein MMC30_003543 [Trapelia coarctata]|nr:hypothetical protein [Trapelia coarctata]